MAFPIVRSASGEVNVGTTIPYPPIIKAGDTLVWFCGGDTTPDAPTESGWTLLADYNAFGRVYVFYKTATGSESGTFTADSSRYYNVIAAINAGSGATVTCSVTTQTGDTPDPPSHTPAGGAREYLWLAFGGASATNFTTPIGAPTDYTLFYSANGLALAYRNLNAASDDPGVFTDNDANTASAARAATVAIFGAPIFDSNNLFFGSNF